VSARQLALALFACGAAGCYTSVPYVPPTKLDAAKEGAVVMAASVPGAGALPGRTQLDVYSFASGCPDLTYRLRDRGYRGSVGLADRHARAVVLPGDQPVLLKAEWKDGSHLCASAMVFRPRSQATYMFGFAPPESGHGRCGAAVEEVVGRSGGHLETAPVRNVRRVGVDLDLWSGLVATDDVCAMANVPSDEPPRPADPGPPAAAEETSNASSTSSVPAREQGEPPAVAADPPAPAPVHALPAVVAAEPAAPPAPHPRISGYALGVRFGFAAGGETLARAQGGGSDLTLTAGGGATFAADLRLTPLWLGDAFGFGAGAEIGWKGQNVSASNGSISLNRYPLIVTAHAIARVGSYSYFLLAGGIEKDLAIDLSGSGAGAVDGVHVDSSVGGVGSLAFVYALTPHLAFDGTVRFAVLHYTLSDPTGTSAPLSAGYGGFTLGGQYHF
jgi:hypothetical protein